MLTLLYVTSVDLVTLNGRMEYMTISTTYKAFCGYVTRLLNQT